MALHLEILNFDRLNLHKMKDILYIINKFLKYQVKIKSHSSHAVNITCSV